MSEAFKLNCKKSSICEGLDMTLPRWISVGKQGNHRSSSSAQEKRKIAGQTIRIEPSSIKQLAIAMACEQGTINVVSGGQLAQLTHMRQLTQFIVWFFFYKCSLSNLKGGHRPTPTTPFLISSLIWESYEMIAKHIT